MYHPVLDQVRSGGEPLVAEVASVRPVAEVQVLVLHENVLVAEAAVADGALVGLFADVRQPHVPDQAVLVAELLGAQRALERAVMGGRRLGQQQQVGGRYLRRRGRRRDRLRSPVLLRRRRRLVGWRRAQVVGGTGRRGTTVSSLSSQPRHRQRLFAVHVRTCRVAVHL